MSGREAQQVANLVSPRTLPSSPQTRRLPPVRRSACAAPSRSRNRAALPRPGPRTFLTRHQQNAPAPPALPFTPVPGKVLAGRAAR
jgi:hypothetical protein